MRWKYITIEGYCFGEIEHKYPCARKCVSTFCLGAENISMCPYFAYSETTEREASYDVPLRLIIWDRLYGIFYAVWDNLSWWFWGKWTYDDSWMDKIQGVRVPEIEEIENKQKKDFPIWLEKNERVQG